jgi:hypothetical protein
VVGTHPRHPLIPGGDIAAAVTDQGGRVPEGLRLVALAERPELAAALNRHNVAAWPAFMLEDAVSDRLWHHLHDDLAAYQLLLLDADGTIAAAGNSAPLAWDGTDHDLPEGWDDQFERTVADLHDGRSPTALGALQIVVAAGRRGDGLSGLMVGAFRAHARLRGLGAVIACIRPTLKERFPRVPIEQYATWRRLDGAPFDPWIRLHVRLGGRIVRASPSSMRVEGTVAEWESWTDMVFPDSGAYVVPGAAAPVSIDRSADQGIYLDPNVWIVHDLGDQVG